MKIKKILVFGNPLVPEDSTPLRILPELRKAFPDLEFKELDAAEQVEDEGRELAIIDSVSGIGKIEMIEDLDSIRMQKIYTMHDFDLGITLKLLKRMGKIDSVLIFGVPLKYPARKALAELQEIISRHT